MSAIIFWEMAKGNLPHLPYIYRKLEPLGVEFKAIACYVTGYLLFVEVNRRNQGVNNSK